MKKFLWLCLFLCSAHPLQIGVKSQVALLVDFKTGRVLYEKNADVAYPPASVMKIATVIYALESGIPLDQTIVTSDKWLKKVSRQERVTQGGYDKFTHELVPDSASSGIIAGEKLRLIDLLYGAMITSGCDACNHIAVLVDGDLDLFVAHLNDFVKRLDCHTTHFENTHGFYHPAQVTTARDLARLTCYAFGNSLFTEIAKTHSYERPKTNKQPARIFTNFNALICPGNKYYYPYAVGGKTGYHSEAGHNLAVLADNGERTLVAVIMQAEDRDILFRDAIQLCEKGFHESKVVRTLFVAEEAQFKKKIPGARTPLVAKLSEDVWVTFYPSVEPEMRVRILWKELRYPLTLGQLAGELQVVDASDTVLATRPLFVQTLPQPTTWFHVKRIFLPWGLVGLGGGLLTYIVLRQRLKARKRHTVGTDI